MTVGFKTFVPKRSPTVFVVRNIAPGNKTIKIFNVPIKNGHDKDLLDIPEVSEADIRHSLLKGVLNLKIRCKEITIINSNIDLLQFDDVHKQFLIDAGITDGIEIIGGGGDGYGTSFPFLFRQNVPLIGVKNGINRIFSVPNGEHFVNQNIGNHDFRILIRHNGKGLEEGVDYMVSESGGSGTGYDTIIFSAFAPIEESSILADYVIED